MAVDFFHRLLVSGKPADVRAFRDDIHREYARTIAGETWTEIVPFSFAGLYELAPAARRVESEIPIDPYDLSAWPMRAVEGDRAEIRYQMQTCNLELLDFLRPLARALPRLTFTLTTLCFDDSSIESYRLHRRREQRWVLPDRRRDFHWERAREKFKLVGEEVYEDDEADQWAEEEMLTEAFGHWDEAGRVRRGRAPRRYRWWNAIPLRDLDTERKLSLLEMGLVLDASSGTTRSETKKPRGKKRKSDRGTRASASRPGGSRHKRTT
jgi:hypothetical protein